MEKIIIQNKIYEPYEYSKEAEFEEQIVEYSSEIFGSKSIYIDVKKRIGNDNIITIPDGYLIDFSFKSDPRLYIIENELVKHDPYRHIGQQLLKFSISYKTSGRKIKKFLLDNILKTKAITELVNQESLNSGYRNIDDLLEDLIFEKPVSSIVIIDKITDDLENVLSQLSMKTDLIEFQTFINGSVKIHKFTPFQSDLKESKIKVEDINTIVIATHEDGFNEVFLGENSWYKIRISSSMLDRIKYIAAYQTAPISAITHYAEVATIEKYKDSNKYIAYFKNPAKEIGPITLPKNNKSLAPQSPRYTTIAKLLKAKTLYDIF